MRIAFLSSNAYGMLTGGRTGATGGAQIQQAMVGRELAARGHEVCFLENPSPNKESGVVDGVRVHLLDEITGTVTNALADRNLPVRTVPRFRRVLRALRAVDPDVCYRRVPVFELFPLWAYTRYTGTPYVYGFAHDSELTNDPVTFDHALNDNRYYWGAMQYTIGAASTLVAQNPWQRDRARERFDAPVELVPNGFNPTVDPDANADADADTDTDSDATSGASDRPTVLWVSTLRTWKHPEYVLALADDVPGAEFVVVGGRADETPSLYDEVADGAARRENVRFEGFVPHDELMGYYREADVFLNTSSSEGFPNTFLEAWSTGTPVVSFRVDPSGALASETAGLVAGGSRDRLREHLRRIVADDAYRRRLAQSAATYFEANHSIDAVADRYEEVFGRLAG